MAINLILMKNEKNMDNEDNEKKFYDDNNILPIKNYNIKFKNNNLKKNNINNCSMIIIIF